jgi:AcrR family transcriptional regulator
MRGMAVNDTEGTPLSLRERKKRRTLEELADSAARLFEEQGFEATTLEEVVAAAEVSKRTFFRYYGSKEAVALAPEGRLWERYVAEVAERPLGGTVLDTLRAALLDTVAAMPPGWEERFYACRRLAAHSPTPALRDHTVVASFHAQAELTAILERRLGISSEADVRLRMLGEFALSAWRCGAKEWVMGREPGQTGHPAMDATPDPRDAATAARVRGGRERLLRRVDEAFAAIPASLALSAD